MKKYLLAGLLVWMPLAITIWVLNAVLGLMDGVFFSLITAVQSVVSVAARAQRRWAGCARSPAWASCVMVAGLLLTGVFATNIFGQWALRQWHRRAEQHPDRQVDLQLGQAGVGHAVLEQRQRLPRGGAGAVPARGLLDHRLRHRQAAAARRPST